MFEKKVVEKIKTHNLCSVIFFFENRAIYEIMLKNIVVRSRPQMTICHMRIACRIPKATNTHSGCVILIDFPLQQWLHERASMLRYTYSTLPVLLIQRLSKVYSIRVNINSSKGLTCR
jgi:hypothetical protein